MRQQTRQIKLMADYQCWPLWLDGNHEVGNVDPATLPLAPQTVDRLYRWGGAFTGTLNLDDPLSSGFPTEEAFEAFEKEGACLWLQLREELAPNYTVVYKSLKHPEVLTDPGQISKLGPDEPCLSSALAHGKA